MRKKFVCLSKDCKVKKPCKMSVKVEIKDSVEYYVCPDRCCCSSTAVADWTAVEDLEE